MFFKYFSKNGELLPIEQAVIPISNIEYSYGFGVYESIRVVNGVPYFLLDHVERLLKSAEIINLEHNLTRVKIEKYIKELVKKTEVQTFNLKILLIGAFKKENVLLFILPLNPLFPDKKLYRDGATTITINYERIFPNAKTLNMLKSYLEYRKARQAGCYDSLLVNKKGYITEGTRTNFFTVKNNVIYTPPENEVLQGVTRKVIFDVAAKNNIKIIEKNLPLSKIDNYDGAFITSTSSKIVPIVKINDIQFEIPQLIKDLIKLFKDYLDAQN